MRRLALPVLALVLAASAPAFAAVTVTYSPAERRFEATATAGESIVLSVDGSSHLLANGVHPSIAGVPTPTLLGAIDAVSLVGDGGANAIDASAIPAPAPLLESSGPWVTIDDGGGTGDTILTGPTKTFVTGRSGSATIQFDAIAGEISLATPGSWNISGGGTALLAADFQSLPGDATTTTVGADGALLSIGTNGASPSTIRSSIPHQYLDLRPGAGQGAMVLSSLAGTPAAAAIPRVSLFNLAGLATPPSFSLDATAVAVPVFVDLYSGIEFAGTFTPPLATVAYYAAPGESHAIVGTSAGSVLQLANNGAVSTLQGASTLSIVGGEFDDTIRMPDLVGTDVQFLSFSGEGGNDSAWLHAMPGTNAGVDGGAGGHDSLYVQTDGRNFTDSSTGINIDGCGRINYTIPPFGNWEDIFIGLLASPVGPAWMAYE